MIDKATSLSFSTWRKIAMATWRPRKDPMISATADIEASSLLHYIEDVRAATGCHVTPAHLVGRAAAKVFQALPELNGRVAFGSFLPSPSIDCFFVVSLRTDRVSGAEAAETDLSGAVVRHVDTKPPWVIAKELADRASRIRHDDDPQFKRAKAVVKDLPPMLLRPVMDWLGFVTETLQLPVPFLGVEARPYGSILVSNVGTYGLDSVSAPVPTFCHVPITVVAGAVTDKVLRATGTPSCVRSCRSRSVWTTASWTATRPRRWRAYSANTWTILPRSIPSPPALRHDKGRQASGRPVAGGWPRQRERSPPRVGHGDDLSSGPGTTRTLES